jgi:hypothetical protein
MSEANNKCKYCGETFSEEIDCDEHGIPLVCTKCYNFAPDWKKRPLTSELMRDLIAGYLTYKIDHESDYE